MSKIRVAICDDMEAICTGYKMYIDNESDMECAQILTSSEECIEYIQNDKPDVLLLDIYIENETSGIELLKKVKTLAPDVKIIMMTSYNNSMYVFHALMNGADGYVTKDTDGRKIIGKIRKVVENSDEDSNKIMEEFIGGVRELYQSRQNLFQSLNLLVKLSNAEYEILHDIYEGMTYKKIAEKRVVEECTVKTCASRILKKMGKNSMKELVEDIREQKLFELF